MLIFQIIYKVLSVPELPYVRKQMNAKKFTGTCWKNTGESLKGLIVAIFRTIIKWITWQQEIITHWLKTQK